MGIRDRWISLLHRAATGTKKTRTLLTPIGMVTFEVFTGRFVSARLSPRVMRNDLIFLK